MLQFQEKLPVLGKQISAPLVKPYSNLFQLAKNHVTMSFLQPNLEPLWTPSVGNVWCPFAKLDGFLEKV